MAPLFRRRLRCFYCSKYSNESHADNPRTWLCGHCEAVNHLDEHGNISDPPAQSNVVAPHLRFAALRSPSPPVMTNDSPFCDNCQRNYTIIDRAMAEYIPDEDDPDYDKYIASEKTYRAELETRYPYPCETCVTAVNNRLRSSHYLAKVDVYRRLLQKSKHTRRIYTSPRQLWTHRIVQASKWIYILGVVAGLGWHGLGIFAAPPGDSLVNTHPMACLQQLWTIGEVDTACFNSTMVLRIATWGCFADLVTVWWNAKLAEKTSRAGGRMRGLTLLWIVRALILGARFLSLRNFKDIPIDDVELRFFRYTHVAMIATLGLSIFMTWYLVSIEYQSTKSFMQPIDPHLPHAQSTTAGASVPDLYKPARPKVTTYDTMAQSFASSLANQDEGEPIFPPSPTLSMASESTRFTEASTPYTTRKFSTTTQDDAMDWTPTHKRFASSTEVYPAPWAKPEPRPSPAPAKHSIFAQRDPNPFANRIPAFPKNAIQEKTDPWKPGVWAPALPENKRNFFADMMSKGASPDTQKRLTEGGVPKKVKADAEMFQAPQFKYDYQGYTGYKTTGLEDKFNGLFS